MPGGVGGARASLASTRFCERREVRSLPATHLVVMCQTRREAERALIALREILAELGLTHKDAKTRIVELREGGEGP
jgi:hypothetical protein